MKNATTKITGESSVNKRSPGAAKPSPVISEGKPNHAKAPNPRPNTPLGANSHVTLDKSPQGGAVNRHSSFTAPRKDPSSDPTESGFSRMPMYTGGNGKGNGKR